MSEELPPFHKQVTNFATAVVKEAAAIVAGQEPVTAEEHTRRLNICFTCPHYTEEGKCSLCGCPMITKSSWRSTKCADNPPKW
jgi:hypothetical protein